MNFSAQKKLIIATIIIIGLLIAQMSVDLYLPSLPAMRSYFMTSNVSIQMSLILYFFGYGLGQLFYGPFADHFGRKPIMIVGLGIGIVAAVCCSLTTSLALLLGARFFQGIGMAANSTIWRTGLRDIYEGPAYVKVMSYSSIAWVLTPIVAPLIGAYIQTYLGWRFNFVLMLLLYVALLFVIIICLPETLDPMHHCRLQLSQIFRNYTYVLTHQQFLSYMMCNIIVAVLVFGFSMTAPFLFQVALHLTPIKYGWALVFIASGYMIGSSINIYFSYHHLILQKLFIGALWGTLLVSSVMLGIGLSGLFNFAVITMPMFIIMIFLGIIYPQCVAAIMAPFAKIAGIAGALFGVILFIGVSLGTTFISYLPLHNQIPLSLVYIVLTILALLIYYFFIMPLLSSESLK